MWVLMISSVGKLQLPAPPSFLTMTPLWAITTRMVLVEYKPCQRYIDSSWRFALLGNGKESFNFILDPDDDPITTKI